MSHLRNFAVRLVNLFRRDRLERELDAELLAYLALDIEENIRRGMAPKEARRVALARLGGVDVVKEECRDVRRFRLAGDLWQDLQYGWRKLAKSPGFSAFAVFVLAVGIGANTVVFTIADGLLFRPPPFEGADRLHWIYDVNDELGFTLDDRLAPSSGNFVDWREQARSIEFMVAWRNWFFSVAGPRGHDLAAEQVRGVHVSPAFFDMLGVQAAVGRTFRPEEEEPGRDRVVVITDGFWERRYGADTGIVGSTILVDGEPFSVIGVTPPDFYFLWPDSDLFMPMTVDGDFRDARGSHDIVVLARLAPDITLPEAQAEMDQVAANLARARPATNDGWRTRFLPVFPLNQGLRPALMVLLAAVGCVLLIACLNVAGLLLVRGGVRQREIALRASLGASRGRLIQQMLTESALLAFIGAVVGVCLATAALRFLAPLMPTVQIAQPLTLAPDMRVLAFTVGVAAATAITFGLLPAMRSSRTQQLRVGAAQAGHRLAGGRAVLAAEIALSLMLLVGAVLLVRSLWHLQQVDPGFRADRLLTMQLWLPETRYEGAPEVAGFSDEVLRRFRQFPEVAAAATVNTRPFLGWSLLMDVDIPEQPRPPNVEQQYVAYRIISPGYLETLGIPLVRGRGFVDGDGPRNAPVALVNQAMVRRFWPDRDPIGTHLRTPVQETNVGPWTPYRSADAYRIVGVVGDTREDLLRDTSEPVVYLAHRQNPSRFMHLLVRTSLRPEAVSDVVQSQIREIDPNLGVYDLRSMDAILGDVVAQPRLNSLLLWVFAGVALLLSAVGVYGVSAYAVSQRSREFAIRLALGARPSSVFGMVTRESLTVGAIGVAAGLCGAVLLGRTLSSVLYGVAANDLVTLVGAAGVVLGVTLLACWRTARKAAGVEPMAVLRTE